MAYAVPLQRIERDASGTVLVNCDEIHPFNVGDKVNIVGVIGGGTVSFSKGMPFTVTAVQGPAYVGGNIIGYGQFKYAQAGPAGTGFSTIAIASATPIDNRRVRITLSSPLQPEMYQSIFRINGVTQTSGAALSNLINGGTYVPGQWRAESGTSLIFKLSDFVYDWNPGGSPLNWTGAYLTTPILTAVAYLDDGINAKLGIVGGAGANYNWNKIIRPFRESVFIAGAMRLVGNSKGLDYAFNRLVNVADFSRLTRSRVKLPLNISQPPATWRSVFDSFVEVYSGNDLKKRRYYINQDGQVVYEIINDSKPTTGNAPYSIVTNGPGTPNAVNAVASVAPYSLSVAWDHETSKRALFNTSNAQGLPIVDFIKFDSADALGTAYSRVGAPYFDDVVDYPTGMDAKLQSRQTAAKSYFLERSAPIQSGQFTLRGAGTASWNNLGFTSGYALVTPPLYDAVQVTLASRFSNVLTIGTDDVQYLAAGMTVVTSGFSSQATGFNGTFTIGTVSNGTTFTVSSVGTQLLAAAYAMMQTGDEVATVYGKYVRTGTAPNQIVTATLPVRHGFTTGAQVIVTGLTGTAGSTMVGTATATVVDDYNFTYPSTGTNGTATGAGTVSAYTLVPRWEPGQWVDITCAELGLAGLYRVEQVDWKLEPGSFQQAVTITFNRRNPKLLTKMLREVQK